MKDCPFCGSGEIVVIHQLVVDTARCNECMAIGPAAGDFAMAEKLWNERTKDRSNPVTPAQVETTAPKEGG